MELNTIKRFPTCYIDQEGMNCHESLLQSYQIVQKVIKMLERKDSQETILEIINHIRYHKTNEKGDE